MEISDEELIEKIQRGDTDSFTVIVERYSVQIYNLMYRYSCSVDDAADMTQDVFVRIFEKSGKYTKKANVFSWMYTLALNYARDWSRKKNSHERKIDTFSREYRNTEGQSPRSIIEAGQEVEGLVSALEELASDRKEMVLLRYRHERSIKEIANIFGLTESAVKMRLQRSLDELGRVLRRQEDG